MTDAPAAIRSAEGRRGEVELRHLLLDADNPRFGDGQKKSSQADVLDYIVQKFGVTDVISSLSVNGYFEAEPLVLKPGPGDFYVVAEGNRRLAACLILAGDERASRQPRLTAEYQKQWIEHNRPKIDPVPVIFFDAHEEKDLLSYLGVRHIASSKAWDSYAKAAWVSRIVSEFNMPVRDVSAMIGDQYQTISRMLQGYNVVKQLEAGGQFRPEDSQRKGRGSVTSYPFSWVYTLLGYSAPRAYLGVSEDDASLTPIPEQNLGRGGIVMRAMFGDKSTGREGAITDSRELGALASAFADQEKISLIESGHSIAEIERLTQPARDLVRKGLAQVRSIQAEMNQRLSESPLSAEEASDLVSMATKNRHAATEIERRLRDAGQDNA